MRKKKIYWMTADCFIDCDFNPNMLKTILLDFDIEWVIVFPDRLQRYNEAFFSSLKNLSGLNIRFIYSKYRQRNPLRFLSYLKCLIYSKLSRFDIIYINYTPTLFFSFISYFFDKKKTVFAVHQGNVHAGFTYPRMDIVIRKLTYSKVKYVVMFSKSQMTLFALNFPKAMINYIPLSLKDFGVPSVDRPNYSIIRFLVFGSINYAKNIELLIDAACLVYEKGYRNFRVSINGYCENWDFYISRIKYPEIFETNVRLIPNEDIPNLFNSSHYLVQPYRALSQSGPMKIAFNYNLPVIASDLEGFKDEIIDGVNGYIFPEGNLTALVNTLIASIERSESDYRKLLKKGAIYIEQNYDINKISNGYKDMFHKIINRNER